MVGRSTLTRKIEVRILTGQIILLLLCSSVMANSLFIGITFRGINLKNTSVYLRANIDHSTPTHINKFRANESHHGYFGIYLIGLGVLTKQHFVCTVGEAVLIDDIIQHVFRINSPIHMFNDKYLGYK